MRYTRSITWLGLVLGAIALGGCQTSPFDQPGGFARYPDVPGRQRSLVFAAPVVAASVAQAQAQGIPWYDYRNDAQLTTYAGYQTPTYESSATYTYDRQSFSGGRAFDYYNSSTYRVNIQQGSR